MSECAYVKKLHSQIDRSFEYKNGREEHYKPLPQSMHTAYGKGLNKCFTGDKPLVFLVILV